MNTSMSLTSRAILAVLLMAGFYLMALAIAAFLLYLVYLQVAVAHHIIIKAVVLCLVGAGLILWSIFPRLDRFVAPGLRLQSQDQPRLFAVIADIAQKTRQPMPAEVYLLNEVNAWVTQRGGWMGIGSKRVMGIGLPVLQSLRTDQFQAVLAHEFGHYYGGDTSLGPWIYKTRAAIVRTVVMLQEQGQELLNKPFEWYGKMFLRITQAISRRQEYSADGLAARVVGKEAIIEGLKTISVAGPAYSHFWKEEVAPILGSGFRPSAIEGFDMFWRRQDEAGHNQSFLAGVLKSRATSPYDTHPSLKDRIAAIAALQESGHTVDDQPAIALIDDVSRLECNLCGALFGEAVTTLPTLAWADAGEKVYLEYWRKFVCKYADALGTVTVGEVPKWLLGEVDNNAAIQRLKREGQANTETLKLRHSLLAAALVALISHENGAKIMTLPGDPVRVLFGNKSLELFEIAKQIVEGKLTAIEWQELLPPEIRSLALSEALKTCEQPH